MADEFPIDILLRAKDEMSATLDKATKNVGLFSAAGSALGTIAGTMISGGLSLIADNVGNVAKSMIDGNAEFERYQTQFGVLLGGADAAKERLQQLAEFGAKTPFELPEVVQADKVLQSFGLHAVDAKEKFGFAGTEIRTIAGDVAAGTGANFTEIAGYIGKFSSGATGEAIARFQEMGIMTRQEMAGMGLEFSKSGELLSPLPQATEVMLSLMKKKFGGMMDAQSSTFEGMVSNLNDWVGQSIRTVGQPIFEIVSDSLKDVLAFLNEPGTQAAIKDFAKMLADTMRQVVQWIKDNWPAISKTISDVFGIIRDVWNGVLLPVINAIIPIIGQVVQWVVANWPAFSAAAQTAFQGIAQFWNGTLKPAIEAIPTTINSIVNLAKAAWSHFQGDVEIAFNRVKDNIIRPIQSAIDFVLGLPQRVANIGGDIVNSIGAGITNARAALENAIRSTVLGGIENILRVLGIQSPFGSGYTTQNNTQSTTNNVANVNVTVNGGDAKGVQSGISAGLYQAGFAVTP